MRRGRLKGPKGPQGPWVLAFETGGDHLSVALWRLAEDPQAPLTQWRLVGERIQHRGHQHADAVLKMSDELLTLSGIAPSDLALIASGRGPGGFTGVRVGLATAVGLGVGVGCPVWPVDSLAVLAANAGLAAGPVLPLIDARRNEAYGALYVDGRPAFQARVAPAKELVATAGAEVGASEFITFGSGAVVYGVASPVPVSWHVPRAANTALLAATEWNAAGRPAEGPVVDPAYVRPSDAELNAKK